MKMTSMKKCLSVILCMVLIAALALGMAGCGGTQTAAGGQEKTFAFVAVDLEGTETTFDISTDKATVGEALLEEGIIEGEDGPYGLYVKTVNGITLDWDKDQKYWAFYVDGEYATAGVDLTEINEDAVYMFKPE